MFVVLLTVALKLCVAFAARLAVFGSIEIVTGKTTVTVAFAVFVPSALLFAVTMQLPAAVGAVNVTGFAVVLDNFPQLAVHVTPTFVVFVTVAVKACVPPVTRLTAVGVTVTATGAVTVTVALAVFVASALLVAVTVHVSAVAGAVNVTGFAVVLDNVPQLAAQLTAVFVACVTVAVSIWVAFVFTLTVAGDTVIPTGNVTVTVALAVLVASALLFAVTVQLPAAPGAVNVTGFVEVLERPGTRRPRHCFIRRVGHRRRKGLFSRPSPGLPSSGPP